MEEIKRFDWFFDKHFGLGIRWDDWLYPLHLSIALPFITVTIGIGRANVDDEEALPSITDQPCECPCCEWSGTVWNCEPDIDNDGNLGCPECFEIIEVTA